MARGELTSAALTEAFLARIEAVDHKIASFITVTAERARRRAAGRQGDEAGGYRRGPLHGIPIALKDIYETAGVLTTGHSHLRADYVPSVDAETVRRLKAGGAVILGKLGTHEFANGAMTPDQPFPAGAQSLEHRVPARRLVERLGRGRRGRALHGRHGLRHRRLDPQSGRLLRHRRHQADLRPGQPLRHLPAVLQPRHGGPAGLDGRGLRADARRAGRPRSQRPGLGQGTEGRLRRGAQRPIKGMRIALARAWYEGKSCHGRHGQGHRRGGARAARSRRRRRGSRVPRHPRLSHLRPRHHHRPRRTPSIART